jgi:L-ascorbate metabolism protein UlaG (beta-lactamase superfamily)
VLESLSGGLGGVQYFRDRSSIPESDSRFPMSFFDAFGARATGDRLARMQRSPQYRDGKFQNPVPTTQVLPGAMFSTLKHQLTGKEQRVPPGPLPIVSRTPADFATPPASGLRVTWFGHASTLVEIDGHRVLVDPVWGERVSPSQAFGPKRFHPPPMALHVMPKLDAIVLTHDHYDHLDMYSIGTLMRSVTQERVPFIMPLGVGAHLERWGVPASRIVELDWWETTRVGALTIAAGSARHFSGRGLTNGNRTLWASWSIIGPAHRVFHSGDTGPFDGIADNGTRYGPFDVAMIKIGAYGDTWPDIHLTPEQAVRACTLVQGKLLLPIHWGTFNLAFHAWDEPAERVVAAAPAAGVPLVMPKPGQSIEPASPPPVDRWWRSVGTR